MSYLREHDEHTKQNGGYGSSVVYLSSYLGEVILGICDTCGYEKYSCLHKNMTWHNNNTVLLCDLCGVDGT